VLPLVADGSGLVPLMAMLRHRAARSSTVDARLLLSTRSPGAAAIAASYRRPSRRRATRPARTRPSDGHGCARFWRERAVELVARADVELGEDLVHVVLDGRGLMNSRAPISGMDRPWRASRAIWASWTARSSRVATVRLRAAVHEVAAGGMNTDAAVGEPLDRLVAEGLGSLSLG
jgi:hypothetical protein